MTNLERVLQSNVAFGGLIKVFLDGFVKPFFALLIYGGVGGAFVYFGWYTVRVSAHRRDADQVTVTVNREHFWGLLKMSKTLSNVERADMLTRRGTTSRGIIVSGAYAISGDRQLSLLGFASNVDGDQQRRIVDSMNGYLQRSDAITFEENIRIHNLFGWFGLPLLAIGVWGLLRWPFALRKAVQQYSPRDAITLVPPTMGRD